MRPGRKKGTPKTGGRQKGTPNKVTAEVREAALEYGPDAINELARLMKHAESERVRIMACREILDRAYGKARQTLEHAGIDSVSIVAPDPNDKERMRRLASFLLEDRATTTTIEGKLVGPTVMAANLLSLGIVTLPTRELPMPKASARF